MKDVYTLITGSSNGLGKALAIECARNNMNVLLIALPGTPLKKFSEAIHDEFGVKTDHYFVDLTVSGSEMKVVDWVRTNNYRVNILINNAGISCEGPLEKFTADHYRKLILLNTNAVVLLTLALMEELHKHPKAHILNLGSVASYFPMPYKAVYGSTKLFVLSFSKKLKAELSSKSIKISVLCPGPVVTNRHTALSYLDKGHVAKMMHVKASRVASFGISKMLKGRFLIKPGFFSKASHLLSYLLPRFILYYIVSNILYND